MKVAVENLPREIDSKWIVVRRADDTSLWYYGQYDDEETARKVAVEIRNGIVTEKEEV